MATIIDLGNDAFIVGDSATELAEGEHWCEFCRGDGLDYDGEQLAVCYPCCGSGVVNCTDTACAIHSSLHPA